jgi:DNA-binding MarR family transcriptional regulator
MSSDTPLSNLETHLGYWLRTVSNTVSYSFTRKLEVEGVTVAEWVFMRILYDFDSLSPTVLAERMGMTKGAITKLADRLIEKNLAERTANPDDKRSQTLALKPDGRGMIPRLASLADDNDSAFFGVLEDSERNELERLLRKIIVRRGLTDVPTD